MDFINEVIIHIVVCVEEPVFVCPIFNDGWFNQMLKLKYNGKEKTIPYYWLPKWCGDVVEPSARVLNCYQDSIEE